MVAGSHESKARPGRSQSQGHTASDPPRFSQDTRRRSSRVCPWEASQTVRYRPQHACISACMPIVLSCSTYAILVLHYSVIPLIRSITARAHHPHQALDPNVPRTYSCRLISQLVFAKQTGEACRQKQSKASPLSSGTQVLGRWSVVDSFVDRSGHPATRSLASAPASCVLRLCFPPYIAPLSYSPRACRLQVEVFVMRPSLLLGPCRALFVSLGLAGWLTRSCCGLDRFADCLKLARSEEGVVLLYLPTSEGLGGG
jgi:hypothetical protein